MLDRKNILELINSLHNFSSNVIDNSLWIKKKVTHHGFIARQALFVFSVRVRRGSRDLDSSLSLYDEMFQNISCHSIEKNHHHPSLNDFGDGMESWPNDAHQTNGSHGQANVFDKRNPRVVVPNDLKLILQIYSFFTYTRLTMKRVPK